MFKRNKFSYSQNKYKTNQQNNNFQNLSKENNNNKVFTSPEMKNEIKDILLDMYGPDNEIRRRLFEKNNNETSDISDINKIKSIDYSQSDTSFKSPEKQDFKTYLEKRNNNTYMSPRKNLNIIKNGKDIDNGNINLNCINNKEKQGDFLENKFDNYNSKKDKYKNIFLNGNDKICNGNKNKKNKDLMNFRHSNNLKYKKDKEDSRKIYNSKRYNKNFGIDYIKDKNEIRIFQNNIDKNQNQINIDDNKENEDYINQKILINKNKNNELNGKEESSQSIQKIENIFIEESNNQLKRVNITGYKYKINNRPKKLELKNEILSEINNVKNKLLIKDNFQNKDKNIISKKFEISKLLESNNEPEKNIKKINDNTYESRYKYNSMDKFKKRNYVNKTQENIRNYLKNKYQNETKRYNSLENTHNNKDNNNNIQKNNYYKDKIYNNNTFTNKATKYNNYFSVNKNNDYNYNQKNINIKNNYLNHNTENGITYVSKNINKIKTDNLIDYKYRYYINKKNRKLRNTENGSNSVKIDEISSFYDDFLKIKNSKRKRFHSNIKLYNVS